jgi:hypothetical protein
MADSTEYSLLTPQEVADLLKISLRTVFRYREALNGFYPFGTRALRFRAAAIYDAMEGMGQRKAAQVQPERREILNRKKIKTTINTDPNRHGLFGVGKKRGER